MREVIIDFETRSRAVLDKTNIFKYSRHPSTSVLCMSYCESDGPEDLWRPGDYFPLADVWESCLIVAFNVEFELCIWNEICVKKYGWPELPPEKARCLQARSSYMGLPRGLAKVGAALGLGHKAKDQEGHKIMRRLIKPVGGKISGCVYAGGEFDTDPKKHQRNFSYCLQDAVAERMVRRLVCPLPESERSLWLAHWEINKRGVPVDIAMCRNAVALVAKEMRRLRTELAFVTGEAVRSPTQVKALKEWVISQGVATNSLAEGRLDELLADPATPENVRTALCTRKLSRDSSASKYQAILNHADPDGRCRGSHSFFKAGTGRFAGSGVNFLNLRRLREDDIQENVQLADDISDKTSDLDSVYRRLRNTEISKSGVLQGGVIPALGSIVRLAVCAGDNKKLVVSDYSGIEMRVLHWLAGDKRMLKQIRDFDNGVGEEPYVQESCRRYQGREADRQGSDFRVRVHVRGRDV